MAGSLELHRPKAGLRFLSIYAGSGDVPALLGSYKVENGSLVFHPTYPIAAGVHYRAIFQSAFRRRAHRENIRRASASHQSNCPRRAGLSFGRRLAEQSASSLHLFLRADEPRRSREPYPRARFGGKELAGSHAVFLPGEELWEPGYKRLTMTFDPGRIKRGLTSNEKIGPPLTEGKRYTLVIDADVARCARRAHG